MPARRSKLSALLAEELNDLKSVGLWRAAFAEFVGTGLLCVFTIAFGMTGENQAHPPLVQVSIAVGFFIAVIITALLKVSGGHVNPIISFGFFISGHVTLVRCIVYSVFQCAGAVTGSGFIKWIVPEDYVGGLGLLLPAAGIPDKTAVVTEGLIGFFLVFVTLAMVDPGRNDVASLIPLLVGFTVTVNISLAHALSGGCMNPARNFGPAVVMGNWDRQWIYWVGPMLGTAIAALGYEVFFSVLPFKEKRFFKPVTDDDDGKKRSAFVEDDVDGMRLDDKLLRNKENGDKVPESNI